MSVATDLLVAQENALRRARQAGHLGSSAAAEGLIVLAAERAALGDYPAARKLAKEALRNFDPNSFASRPIRQVLIALKDWGVI